MTIKIVLFSLKNKGNIQNAVNNKELSQSLNQNVLEHELLKQENLHLKEKVKLLERLLNLNQS